MFQCMIDTIYDQFNLYILYEHLLSESIEIVAYYPGALGKILSDDDIRSKKQIGSLHIKLQHTSHKLSILVFKNNKIKLSGGVPNDSNEDGIIREIIAPSLIKLRIISDIHEMKIHKIMFNGNYRTNKLMYDYMTTFKTKFCDYKFEEPKKTKLSLKKHRGRICAIKVMNPRGGCFMVDHKMNFQFFAYPSIDIMKDDCLKIIAII